MDSKVKFTKRKLPHWQADGATYFVTFRLKVKPLSMEEVRLVKEYLVSGDETHYNLLAAVVMPDHVHLLLRLLPGTDLSRVMKGMKGAAARRLNKYRGTRGTVWQAESFDRIVRDEEEFRQKLEYMYCNPVKSGLVDEPEDYPGWFRCKTD